MGDKNEVSSPTEILNCPLSLDLSVVGEKFLNAAETGDVTTLDTLLQVTPNLINFVDEDGYTALHRAAYSEAVDSLKFLLLHGSSVDARTDDGWTPLHSASRWNSFQCVKILVENEADVNAQSNGGATALHLAAESGEYGETLTLLLLHPSIDVKLLNNAGDTAHEIAARAGGFSYLFNLAKESINKL